MQQSNGGNPSGDADNGGWIKPEIYCTDDENSRELENAFPAENALSAVVQCEVENIFQ